MEVCVDSVQSAVNAENGGAKRIELCTCLGEGGTTPSFGLFKVIKRAISLPVFVMIRPRGGDFLYTDAEFDVMIEDCKQLIDAGADGIVFGILTKKGEIDVTRCQKLLGLFKVIKRAISLPVFVMIRPRGGDFLYTDAEFDVMIEDCKQLIDAGADGIVFGILTKKGEIDVTRCQKLLDIIKPLPVTFHRAFDMVPDQSAALEVIINLGFDRVLTSGGKADVLQGASHVKDLVDQAEKRILIIPGGGINEENLSEILKVTGVKEFHGSARVYVASQMEYSNSCVSMGGTGDEYRYMVASLERIKQLTVIAKDFLQ